MHLPQQFGREERVLYSVELSKQLPELFIHLSGDVRETLLQRVEQLAQQHAYTVVLQNRRELQPVLLSTQRMCRPNPRRPPRNPPTRSLGLSIPAESTQ